MGGFDFGGADLEFSPGVLSTENITAPDPMAFSLPPEVSSFGGVADAIGKGVSNFGDFARGTLPFLGAGVGLMGAATGALGATRLAKQTGIAEKAAKTQQGVAQQAQNIAAPAAAFGTSELQQAQAGKIPPAIQAQIDNWVRGAKISANDYAARSGQGNSTMLTEWLSWIDKQGEAMAAQALQDEQQIGLAGIGTAGNILGQAAGAAGGAGATAAGQQQSIQALIASANQVLARLTGGAS